MAKLVEILAKELGEWPENSTHCVQMVALETSKGLVSFTSGGSPAYNGYEWSVNCEGADRLSLWVRDGFQSDIATDHATAIVTREMWQAERDKQAAQISGISTAIAESDRACVRGLGDGAGLLTGYTSNPFAIRDRIREIDATIKAMTAERAGLVSKLAGEGFALIVQTTDPVEDMSDWRDWRVGDRIEVLACSECDTGVFAVIELESSDYDGDLPARLANIGWPEICYMRWHSRPTA